MAWPSARPTRTSRPSSTACWPKSVRTAPGPGSTTPTCRAPSVAAHRPLPWLPTGDLGPAVDNDGGRQSDCRRPHGARPDDAAPGGPRRRCHPPSAGDIRRLRGSTAAASDEAARRHEALWEGQLALERLLERIAQERGTRRSAPQWVLVRIDALLQGASVELPEPGKNGIPRLTEQMAPTFSCSVAEAFDRMSADFDVVTRLLADVAQAWGETTDRLQQASALLADLGPGSAARGHRSSERSRPVDAGPCGEAESTVRHDPLALDPDRVTQLESRARRLRDAADEADRERRARGPRSSMQRSRASVPGWHRCTPVGRSWTSGRRKWWCPARPSQRSRSWSGTSSVSAQDCAQARSLGQGGAAEDLRRRSARLGEEITRLASSERARMARRDELRGLLSAYRAKANALRSGRKQ